jgi:hypothetical protein
MSISNLRKEYHQRICQEVIRVKKGEKGDFLNFADGNNKSSVEISWNIAKELGYISDLSVLKEQTIGDIFEDITKDFLEKAFHLLAHIRPGQWHYATDKTSISGFAQYEHLAELNKKASADKALAAVLGVGYIVKPDIVIGRYPVSNEEINKNGKIVDNKISEFTPLRESNQSSMLLHASISCKWTLRSDRSQNARTEALNLIRNRKGNLPHIVAVIAEPLPTRIATLALGTGDIDCVYHFALPELKSAIEKSGNEGQMDMLAIIIEGNRLRDISDLPFDLAA